MFELNWNMKNAFLFALLIFLFAGTVYPDSSRQSTVLHWESPKRFEFKDQPTEELLYFQGAVFNDTLAQVPYYVYRQKGVAPFFRKEYSLVNPQYAAVSPAEQRILEATGWKPDEIVIHSGTESVQKEILSFAGFYPLRYNAELGQFEKLVSFELKSQDIYDASLSYEPVHHYTAESVLAQGSWYKVCVDQTGIFRLTYSDLSEMGVNLSGLPRSNIRLFGNGSGMLPEANDAFRYDDLLENAIYVSGGASGNFSSSDYILFYGKGPDQWLLDEDEGVFNHVVHLYSHENCYYLTTDQGVGKRITSQGSVSATATHTVNSFQDHAFHQRDLENLLGSGQVWFGEVFDATLSRVFNFNFPDLDPSGPARVKTYVAARSATPSTFTVQAGNQQMTASVQNINPAAYEGYFARHSVDSMWISPNQANNLAVTLTYNRTSSGSRGWLNYIAVNVTRHLRFTGPQMGFRNTQVTGPGNVAQYVLGNASGGITVWDVTDRFNIRQQQMNVSGSTAQFRLPADSLREFVAFNGASFYTPRLAGAISNQNLHGMDVVDMIIVSPGELLPEAQRLAAFRQENDGLAVAVVTPQQIYNEFSSGAADVSAIRNFMKMFYDRAEGSQDYPRYLLLFGNGTVDNKDNLGFGGNLIPTYQTRQSLTPSGGFEGGVAQEGTHMTDDYFGLLNDDEGQGAFGIVDIGIGRLPVRTPQEAAILVDKLIRYETRVPGMEPWGDNMQFVGTVSNYADWRNVVVLVADDQDNNTHFNHAETLAYYMLNNHSVYNVDKIYLDAYTQISTAGGSRYPEVNQAINDRVNKGALLVNYIGHGGTQGLAHERILTFDDIATWNNYYNMPVLMTATCEFSSFDQPDPNNLSAGVRILQKPDGGAIALYTTIRLAWSSSNLTLNSNFMQNAFVRDENGNFPRLGDLIRVAKQKSSSGGNLSWRLRNFTLLGDPSMQMAYPQYKVVTESMPDTIRAFQEVTVTGYVADEFGNKVNDYNGVIFPSIYDKKNQFRTLGNDSDSHPANFTLRNSMLYKGKASVENGEFAFSFIVPQDIAYNYGSGKISYYVDNGQVDGSGYFNNFIIGGTLEGYAPDYDGPEVNLYLNDTTFISGGTTNENPILLALIRDESGINITGRIGHDIVAFLNEDTSRPIVLNNFYEADLDTYQSGRVVYPFYNLPDGRHSLSLRVWDIHNNPTLASIDFIVSSSAQLALMELKNFPNPFSQQTSFVFSHNQSFEDMDVRIDIFDLAGKLQTTLRSQVQSAGYQSPPITWDGTDMSGRPLGNGMYIYRLTLTTPSGEVSHQTEKLVILR
jgi:hypothetical protein